ncbi:WD40 repeat protein [Raphanus sativus]|nr:WD40 repeat protein [Raphanus sativus]
MSSVLSFKAHDADVNVISWNRLPSCMLASGSDDGAFSIHDLRFFNNKEGDGKKGDAKVAHFEYHKHPITSTEWSPHESSTLAVSSGDNQLTCRIWDLSLEKDEDQRRFSDRSNIVIVPNCDYLKLTPTKKSEGSCTRLQPNTESSNAPNDANVPNSAFSNFVVIIYLHKMLPGYLDTISKTKSDTLKRLESEIVLTAVFTDYQKILITYYFVYELTTRNNSKKRGRGRPLSHQGK